MVYALDRAATVIGSPAYYIPQKKMYYKELKQTPGAVQTCGVNEANLQS
jgi:hypothetical protein